MTLKQACGIIAKGFCMGTADVVPGVSGGTMALILGIYQRLLEAIRAFDLTLLGLLVRAQLRRSAEHTDLAFLALLGGGIFAALMFFTRVVSLPALIRTHPEPVFALFFGLIAASIVVLLRSLERLSRADWAFLLAGAALGWLVVNAIPVDTPETPAFIVLAGALAICALILPGISGSFVLLILKKYAFIFDAIGRLDLGVLAPFALGAVCGLMLFSRLLVWLLHRFYQRSLAAIVGLLIGSLWVIWPFQERIYTVVRGKQRLIGSHPGWPEAMTAPVLGAFALIAVGMAAVMVLSRLAGARGASR